MNGNEMAGTGAGAGALKSLKAILGGLPAGGWISVFVFHHPDFAQRDSFGPLKGRTAERIVETADGMKILAPASGSRFRRRR